MRVVNLGGKTLGRCGGENQPDFFSALNMLPILRRGIAHGFTMNVQNCCKLPLFPDGLVGD